jgi:hypothetical protein
MRKANMSKQNQIWNKHALKLIAAHHVDQWLRHSLFLILKKLAYE